MNEKIPVKAGLKRVWILISILWVIVVLFIALPGAVSIFNNSEHTKHTNISALGASDICAKLEAADDDFRKEVNSKKLLDFAPVNPSPRDILVHACFIDPDDNGLFDINGLRKIFPTYNNLSEKQLIDIIHDEYYADLPINKYYKKIGYESIYKMYFTDLFSATKFFTITLIFYTSPVWFIWLVYWAYIGFPLRKIKKSKQ